MRKEGMAQAHTEGRNILVRCAEQEHVDGDLRARALDRKRLVEGRCRLEECRFLTRIQITRQSKIRNSEAYTFVVPSTFGSSLFLRAPAPRVGRLEDSVTIFPPMCDYHIPTMSTSYRAA